MAKNLSGEQWKVVKFDVNYTNKSRIEVSNLGRVRTFNQISDGNIINGSNVNGYKILRLKLFTPRDEKTQQQLDALEKQAAKLAKKISSMEAAKEPKKTIKEATDALAALKQKISNKYKANFKERTVNYQILIHRLVAAHFLKKPTAKQVVVAHLDHNKQNNKADNLKWMTIEENIAHQQHSPVVIKEKKERKLKRRENNTATKLTAEKVSQIKKLLKEKVAVKVLAQQFNITDTQLYRIKRGENWGDIKAAK
ncbi:HNH endonuclease [Ferruginibacter yonginensis]|uniref:HNH endonuclease n=1 Tax=Ferruginibacter yonginensis TaxID=1310416 RepID=A0ABV8QLV2_9BACT